MSPRRRSATKGTKAQNRKAKIHKSKPNLIMCFCVFCDLKNVGLKFFEQLDANPAAAELDDAATFEIVEDRRSGLTCGADETRNVVMREWHEVIIGCTRCQLVQ